MSMDTAALQTIMYLWAFSGIVLILIDIKLAQTIVLFLLGLGALTVAIVLTFHPLSAITDQAKVFLFSSIFWTLVLWRPLQKYKYSNSETFHNLKGRRVVLQDKELAPGSRGKAKWSGTIVEVKLADGVEQTVPMGSELIVKSVEGTLFIVQPTN